MPATSSRHEEGSATSSSDGWSIRRRLLLLVGGGSIVLLATCGLLTERLLEQRLAAAFDAELLDKARVLSSLVEREDGTVQIELAGELLPEFRARRGREYFQFWLAGGRTIRSDSLGDADLPRSPGLATTPRYRLLRLPDGADGRSVEISFMPRVEVDGAGGDDWVAVAPSLHATATGDAVTMVLGRSREELASTVSTLRAVLAGGGLLLAGAMLVVVRWGVDRGLLPLHELAARVAAARADGSRAQVATPGLAAEVAPVAARVDELLARVAVTIERERRFSNNVAHELRTPVAELRSLAEVGQRWPGDSQAVRGYFADVRSIAEQMDGLIRQLLSLARQEGGVEPLHVDRVSMDHIVADAWERLASRAVERGMAFDLGLSDRPPLILVTDGAKLSLVVANLFGNAVAHAPAGSRIACRLVRTGDAFRFTVANPAPLLTPADVDFLFERFWRKDEARTDGEHSGLGLTLVRSLCSALGYAVTAKLDDGVLTLEVVGPLVIGAAAPVSADPKVAPLD